MYPITITRKWYNNFELHEKTLKKKNLKVIPTVSTMNRDFAKYIILDFLRILPCKKQPLWCYECKKKSCMTKIWLCSLALSCRSVVQQAHKRILAFKRIQKANIKWLGLLLHSVVKCHQFWKWLHHIKWLCTLVAGYIVIIAEITDLFLYIISNCDRIIIFVTFCMYFSTLDGL